MQPCNIKANPALRLLVRQGFIICWYAYTVNLSIWVLCCMAHPEVCVLSATLPCSSPSQPPLPLLVNRHISIFISRLPRLWAVKCLQVIFFLNFFFPALYLAKLLKSVLELVSCTKKVTWPLMSHTHMSGTRQKNPLYRLLFLPTSNFWMYLHSFGNALS